MKLDDIVSAGITAGVTVLFIAATAARWPEPFRLHKHQIERHNPFAAVFSHTPDRQASVTVANN